MHAADVCVCLFCDCDCGSCCDCICVCVCMSMCDCVCVTVTVCDYVACGGALVQGVSDVRVCGRAVEACGAAGRAVPYACSGRIPAHDRPRQAAASAAGANSRPSIVCPQTGGAIDNRGTLSITNSAFINNRAVGLGPTRVVMCCPLTPTMHVGAFLCPATPSTHAGSAVRRE
jgi:hypothetical protein